jgi:hypothetical protein
MEVGISGWEFCAGRNSIGGCAVEFISSQTTGVGVITVCESIPREHAMVRKKRLEG